MPPDYQIRFSTIHGYLYYKMYRRENAILTNKFLYTYRYIDTLFGIRYIPYIYLDRPCSLIYFRYIIFNVHYLRTYKRQCFSVVLQNLYGSLITLVLIFECLELVIYHHKFDNFCE